MPQVIYKHGEPLWNDINKGKLLIHPSELLASVPAESASSKAVGLGEGTD
jgi:hypothetical protein